MAKMLVLGLVARDVVVDALPYFDQGYEAPRVREAATALVGEETRRYRPTKNYLSYLPGHNYSAFETGIMQTEISEPGGLAVPGTTQYEEVQAAHLILWAEKQHHGMAGVCEQFMAQLDHQAVRIENLELMFQHGCNAWTLYNEHLVHTIERAQKKLQKLRKNIQDLNWQGKNMQVTAGAKLHEMESTWVSLVSKNYEIEGIIVQLENEISQIKQ